MPVDDAGPYLLELQRACWKYAHHGGADPQADAEDAGWHLDQERISRARRRVNRLDTLFGGLLVVSLGLLLAIAGQLVAAGALAVAQNSGALKPLAITAALTTLLLTACVVAMTTLDKTAGRAQKAYREITDPTALRNIAWHALRVEALPARLLVNPRMKELHPHMQYAVTKVDPDTVRMLARENSLSLEQLVQAARALS